MPAVAKATARLPAGGCFAPATRYCPECLAGDGSAIQESFGGPWLKAWHLPVVFACPAHRRLLEHLCPECGQPVHGRRPGAYPSDPAGDAGGRAAPGPVQDGTRSRPAPAPARLLRGPARPGREPPGGRPPANRPAGQDPGPPRPRRPRRHGQRGDAGDPGRLLRRPPANSGCWPAGPGPRPGTWPPPRTPRRPSTSTSPRSAGGRLPRAPRHASASTLRPQTPQPAPGWHTSQTASSPAAPATSANSSGGSSRPAPGRQTGPTGAFAFSARRSRAPRACEPPTILS